MQVTQIRMNQRVKQNKVNCNLLLNLLIKKWVLCLAFLFVHLKIASYLTLVSFCLMLTFNPISSWLYNCDYLLHKRAAFFFLTSLIDVLKYFSFFMYHWIFCSCISTFFIMQGQLQAVKTLFYMHYQTILLLLYNFVKFLC